MSLFIQEKTGHRLDLAHVDEISFKSVKTCFVYILGFILYIHICERVRSIIDFHPHNQDVHFDMLEIFLAVQDSSIGDLVTH